MIVFDWNNSAPAEYMRWGTHAHHRRNTERKLLGGRRYFFASWFKPRLDDKDNKQQKDEAGGGKTKGVVGKTAGFAGPPWEPSRVRLMITSSGFAVQVDDSNARNNAGGDRDYNDLTATLTIK